MEQENKVFLKRLGLYVAPLVLVSGIGMALTNNDGPLYIGFKPSKIEQEHSVNVGPLYVQWGRMIEQEGNDLTYRGK